MRHIIKSFPLLFCLLAPSALAVDVEPVMKVQSISFNYMELKAFSTTETEYSKGTTLEFIMTAGENDGVEASIRVMSPSAFKKKGFDISLQDAKGSHLGGFKYARYDMTASSKTKRQKAYYYLTFFNLPGLGSEGLDLWGTLPARVYSSKTISPPQPLQIKEGVQLFLGDLTMEVAIPKEEEGGDFRAEFRFSSPNKLMQLIGMDFFDQEGKPLIDDKGKPAFSSAGGGRNLSLDEGSMNRTSADLKYSFTQKPDLLNVSVQYWAKAEEVELPLPRKVLFYDPDADKNDEKQKRP